MKDSSARSGISKRETACGPGRVRLQTARPPTPSSVKPASTRGTGRCQTRSPNSGRCHGGGPDESGQPNIYVQPFPNIDDGKWQVSTNGGADPVWSSDGRQLFFVTVGPRMMVAEVETEPTFSPGTPTEAFDLSAYSMATGGRRYDITPDGERFILRRPAGTQTAADDAFRGLIVVQHWFQELTERVPSP